MERRYRGFAVLVTVVAVALFGVVLAFSAKRLWHGVGHATSHGSQPEQQAKPAVDVSGLQAAVATTMTHYPNMNMSVAAVDLTTGKDYHFGDTMSFEAASITKLITASMFLHEVERDRASLDDIIAGDTAQNLLEQLIVNSDNDAWIALDQTLTTDGLSAYAESLALDSYRVSGNTIACSDVALLLSKLYRRELLNERHTQLLLSYMAAASQPEYIVAAAPVGADTYHKAGWLENVMHDAAIINDGKHAYALVIFTQLPGGDYDFTLAQGFFGDITRAANQAFLSGR